MPAPAAAAAAAAPRLRLRDRLELTLRVRLSLLGLFRDDVASKEDTAGGGAGAGTIARLLLL